MQAFFANLLARLYGIYAILAFAGVTILPLALLAVVPGEDHRRWLARNAAKLWFRLVAVRLNVSGMENLPAEPCVVVANHASYLDGVILTAVLPARFTFVIKKEMTICFDCVKQYDVSVYRVVKMGNCIVCGAGVRTNTPPTLCNVADKDQKLQ